MLAIPGVTAPERGATPVTTAIDTAQYTGTITWTPVASPFAASTAYTATIVLTAKAGWTLAGVAANSFTVAGATTVTNAVNTGTVAAVFSATGAVIDAAITLLAIPGVTAPVRGATPVTTAIDTAQYTGTITWTSVASPFAASTAYTATIVLTAKAGWTLTGVVANSFTVAGATATNTVNTGTVAAVFKSTSAVNDYDSVNIGILKNVPTGSFQRDTMAGNISIVSAFRMSEKEITRAQFLTVMGTGTDPSDTTYSSGTSDPVQNTNWYHAIAFCNKLSIAEGFTPVYSVTVGVTAINFTTLSYADIPTASNTDWDAASATWANTGYRLPTEMEWMWAAMGATADGKSGDIVGGVNTGGYAKAFAGSTGSNAIGDYAVYGYSGTGAGRTITERSNPVGSKTGNELGLYDMSGNVWEWNWDRYASYSTGTLTNYRGAASGSNRVYRGGSWGSNDFYASVAYCIGYGPDSRGKYVGFRVVRL